MSDNIHWKCTCEADTHIGHSALSTEDILRIREHRSAFSFETRDKDIEEDHYSDGLSQRERGMRVSNRSRKISKQWRNSVQERSVLRYTTG